LKVLFIILLGITLGFGDEVTKKYINYLQHLPAKTKKYRFKQLVLPPIQKVDLELRKLYLETLNNIQNNKNKQKIDHLMKIYQTNDPIDLLKRIKPHPISITLAQAAIESAWATSRFFIEANNIFGMWTRSTSKEDAIAAGSKRANGRVIYLKRYKSLEDSVRHYYKTLATRDAYKHFREIRYISNDPLEIASYLDQYSEQDYYYTVSIIKVIMKNNFTQYDRAPLPILEIKKAPSDANASLEALNQKKI